MIRTILLSISVLLLANASAYAESTITTGHADNEVKQAGATVNFVVKIAYKMSFISTSKKVALHSNTGNLLVTNQQTNRQVFVSQNSPIKLQQSPQGQYTVASP